MSSRFLVPFAVVVALGCGSSAPSTPTAPATPVPVPTPTPHPPPPPSPSPSPPVASLRVEPPALGGVISIPPGGEVHLHGSFDSPLSETPVLFGDWGDGTRGRSPCGPCRVVHVYAGVGSFKLIGTIVAPDGSLQRRWIVSVQ
jgi:hypothetical protein